MYLLAPKKEAKLATSSQFRFFSQQVSRDPLLGFRDTRRFPIIHLCSFRIEFGRTFPYKVNMLGNFYQSFSTSLGTPPKFNGRKLKMMVFQKECPNFQGLRTSGSMLRFQGCNLELKNDGLHSLSSWILETTNSYGCFQKIVGFPPKSSMD